jgi:hypothetical protein
MVTLRSLEGAVSCLDPHYRAEGYPMLCEKRGQTVLFR